MIISFSGNDGSGKTTIAKTLLKNLRSKGLLISYRHEYDYVLIKYLFRVLGENIVKRERKKYVPIQSEDIEIVRLKKLTFVQRLWPYVVWLDNIVTIFMYKIFYKNRIILLDRHPYDMYLSFEYMGRSSRLIKTLFYLIPKADVHIIFYVEPIIAMNRKVIDHVFPLQFYINQLERYKKIAEEKRIEMHNTEEPLDTTINFVTARIFQKAPKCLKYKLQRNE
jgi:hypothetical protein